MAGAVKTCPTCGHEGGLADFERWDLLCIPCRKEAGPRKRHKYRQPQGGQRLLYTLPPKPKPTPTGRSAKPRDERAVVVL